MPPGRSRSQGGGLRHDAAEPPLRPPQAERHRHSATHHGVTLEDPYHWLRDPAYPKVEDAAVLAYLQAENDYFEAAMAPVAELTEALFQEIKGRQCPDDESVPVRDGAWFYQWRFEPDAQYRVWTRWPAVGEPTQETILDEPALAAGLDYFALGSMAVSHSGHLLAYSTDTTGGERFTLRVKDLRDGSLLAETIENTCGDAVWAADDASFFYLVMSDAWRSHQVRRHVLGTPVATDAVVYEEADTGFWVGLAEASSRQYIVISTGDQVTTEAYLIPTAEPAAEPVLVAGRREGHEYEIDHQGDRFVIRTNDAHRNFRLATAPADDFARTRWTTLVAGSDAAYIRGFQCVAEWIVVEERLDGIDQIRVIDRRGANWRVAFPEPLYTVGLGANPEYATDTVRLGYASMVTPDTVYDYEIPARKLTRRKVREVPSGYDSTRYATRRISAPARDGAAIPISIVHAKDTPLDGAAPLYLYGYGAYGMALPPSFSTARLSLLERGFVFAIAHVRGGGELGRAWYEEGKLTQRANAFNDFVDVARHLIDGGWVRPGRIAIAGGSAGGELMGAVVNQAPELWGAVAAHVPFVDVLNTMLDDSLPLTPGEWPEWGNPIEDKAAFDLIRSYSPYDQLQRGHYPPMFVTAGLNDPRVTYWEPAKYVAKLRTLKTDANLLVLKTNMGAGHGGKSGRYDSLRETAEEYAFMLLALGMADAG